jgi:hypothetical protein
LEASLRSSQISECLTAGACRFAIEIGPDESVARVPGGGATASTWLGAGGSSRAAHSTTQSLHLARVALREQEDSLVFNREPCDRVYGSVKARERMAGALTTRVATSQPRVGATADASARRNASSERREIIATADCSLARAAPRPKAPGKITGCSQHTVRVLVSSEGSSESYRDGRTLATCSRSQRNTARVNVSLAFRAHAFAGPRTTHFDDRVSFLWSSSRVDSLTQLSESLS